MVQDNLSEEIGAIVIFIDDLFTWHDTKSNF